MRNIWGCGLTKEIPASFFDNFNIMLGKPLVRLNNLKTNLRDVLQQTACLVVNPIKVNSFAYLFNCTTVGRASD